MKVCVCITCSARNSMYIRFTAPTPTHMEHSADAETSAQSSIVLCVVPDSKQHMLEGCDRAETDTVLFPFVFILVCVCVCVCVFHSIPVLSALSRKEERKWAITAKVTSMP